jgi:hypothetical protein
MQATKTMNGWPGTSHSVLHGALERPHMPTPKAPTDAGNPADMIRAEVEKLLAARGIDGEAAAEAMEMLDVALGLLARVAAVLDGMAEPEEPQQDAAKHVKSPWAWLLPGSR